MFSMPSRPIESHGPTPTFSLPRLTRMIAKIAMRTTSLTAILVLSTSGKPVVLEEGLTDADEPEPGQQHQQRAVEHARRDAQRRLADLGEEAAQQDGDPDEVKEQQQVPHELHGSTSRSRHAP